MYFELWKKKRIKMNSKWFYQNGTQQHLQKKVQATLPQAHFLPLLLQHLLKFLTFSFLEISKLMRKWKKNQLINISFLNITNHYRLSVLFNIKDAEDVSRIWKEDLEETRRLREASNLRQANSSKRNSKLNAFVLQLQNENQQLRLNLWKFEQCSMRRKMININ